MDNTFGRTSWEGTGFRGALQSGARLQNGKYIIIEVFGQGPFTTCYLAMQTVLGKKAIINEFFLVEHCSRSANGEVVNTNIDNNIYKRFKENWFEEAILLSRCGGNEYFVTVLDTFEENNTAYYVTDFINEEDLHTFTLSHAGKCLSESRAINFIAQISNGLSLLHKNNIHHLNLSPIKVLVDKNERAIIFSVGISRQKIPREIISDIKILARAGYTSPELYRWDPENGELADIYSVGAIFYFLLTGKDPLPAPERFTKPLIEPRNLDPAISPAVSDIVMKAMSMNPEDRYQNLSELIKELPVKEQKSPGTNIKKVVLYSVLAVFIIALVSVGLLGLFQKSNPVRQITGMITQKKMNHLDKLARLSLNEDKTRGVTMLTDPVEKDSVLLGTYYALLIGIENYKDSRYQKLSQPIKDVSSMYDVLTTFYTFEKNNVLVLKDPERKEIFKAMNYYRENLTPNDNLFIFYAGHGRYDEPSNTGYLIPVNAEYNNEADWISFPEFRKKFEVIPARHILFVADACFAGSVFRGGGPDPEEEIDKMTLEQLSKRSRTAFTSSFLKPVPDKSEFLKHILSNLKTNTAHFLLSEDLYISTRNSLYRSTSQKDPVKWGVLQDCGDEGGDFIFIRRPK